MIGFLWNVEFLIYNEFVEIRWKLKKKLKFIAVIVYKLFLDCCSNAYIHQIQINRMLSQMSVETMTVFL